MQNGRMQTFRLHQQQRGEVLFCELCFYLYTCLCVCVFGICDITYLSASVQKSYKATILRGDLFVARLDLQFFPSNQHACREVLRFPRWGRIFRPWVWAPQPHRLPLCPCLHHCCAQVCSRRRQAAFLPTRKRTRFLSQSTAHLTKR